nr:immunoglobulin light chain junction region [Macaca mulatta]
DYYCLLSMGSGIDVF